MKRKKHFFDNYKNCFKTCFFKQIPRNLTTNFTHEVHIPFKILTHEIFYFWCCGSVIKETVYSCRIIRERTFIIL